MTEKQLRAMIVKVEAGHLQLVGRGRNAHYIATGQTETPKETAINSEFGVRDTG